MHLNSRIRLTRRATMKIALVFFVGCLTVLTVSAVPGGYTTKYDNVDLDKILTNERLLKNYFGCLMERGSCTPDGKELRQSLPDAIENDCASCNEKQRNGADKVIRFLIKNKPEMWDELRNKYDPENKQAGKYEKIAKEEKGEMAA